MTLPLALEDTVALFDVVRQHAPPPLIRDVMHNGREIFVRLYEGTQKIYERPIAAS